MQFTTDQKVYKHQIFIVKDLSDVKTLPIINPTHIQQALNNGNKWSFAGTDKGLEIVWLTSGSNTPQTFEQARIQGAAIQKTLNQYNVQKVKVIADSSLAQQASALAEGIALSNYQFAKYFTKTIHTHTLQQIVFDKTLHKHIDLTWLNAYCEAVFQARNLINEPANTLTSLELAKRLQTLGKQFGFKTEVWQKARIEKEKMGGLLAVNKGSQIPPTYSILTYKPAKPINKQPIVLVGKGVVYDTGGLSLKPTANSMDRMKSDMSGAAIVAGIFTAISQLQLPLHVVGLIPSTDNRPGENAYAPGDVITMYDGSTVEVLNTDAEGRLLLADALHHAKSFKPSKVFDFATLTGAASVAIGEHGLVCMGTLDESDKELLHMAANASYERFVEFPLWDEYKELLKSDIADMKNIGGPYAGAITAGKFLEAFTNYPWMHFDIAGVSFSPGGKHYKTPGGTGFGVRLFLAYLKALIKK